MKILEWETILTCLSNGLRKIRIPETKSRGLSFFIKKHPHPKRFPLRKKKKSRCLLLCFKIQISEAMKPALCKYWMQLFQVSSSNMISNSSTKKERMRYYKCLKTKTITNKNKIVCLFKLSKSFRVIKILNR